MKILALLLLVLQIFDYKGHVEGASIMVTFERYRDVDSSHGQGTGNCCGLSSWAVNHLEEVRQFANRLRQNYNNYLHDGSIILSNAYTPWSSSMYRLTGKTSTELDALNHQCSENIISQLRSGIISYDTIAQPNYFESLAAEYLEKYSKASSDAYSRGSSQWPTSSKLSSYISQKQTSSNMRQEQSIYDWMQRHMEPEVVGYKPIVNIDSRLRDYESLAGGLGAPKSTVTVHSYNKSIITNSDGTNIVEGAEIDRKWVDGRLVHDVTRPIGSWSGSQDAWKREEREQFFWFLTQSDSIQKLREQLQVWQRQQDERLLAMAQRYHVNMELILKMHQEELDFYENLLRQHQMRSSQLTDWRNKERVRFDWLVCRNNWSQQDLRTWQHENNDRLKQMARNYRINLDSLINWQIEELKTVSIQSSNQIAVLPAPVVNTKEQERLNELIRQHNETIAQLQNSIRIDQRKLKELTSTYRGNVEDMEKWLKSELAKLSNVITEQRNEMTRITEWQQSERQRLEAMARAHQGSIEELENQIARDRNYMKSLASKYHISIEELEKWQTSEIARLQKESESQLELNVKAWQAREHERLMSIIRKNDLTIEEFQNMVVNDRARLEGLAKTYAVEISDIEEWIKKELNTFKEQGFLKEVEKELAAWKTNERERILAILQKNELTMDELKQEIQSDKAHLATLANKYQVRVEEIEEWLNKELLRLKSEGMIKSEDLMDWQTAERENMMKIVQQSELTIDEFEKQILNDRHRLENLSKTYNVQLSEVEKWIQQEAERLQKLGLLQMRENLNAWQQIERQRLLEIVNKNSLSLEELQQKIKTDQAHLYSLAHQHQVNVEEIEEWIKQEIKKLQQQGLIEMSKLTSWQTQWRDNITDMVKERDFTVDQFHKWLLEDRTRLQALAQTHNMQIEEMEEWVRNEEQRFISLGLLKPNEKLENWQEVERRYLERITQETEYRSTEQLEERLRQDRELLEQLARQYSVQVTEIEEWMKKELSRLRDNGQLQIDNLTAWQWQERQRLEEIARNNSRFWNSNEFEMLLRKDREHMQKLAFQYHTSMEEIEKWIVSEIERIRQQGKSGLQRLTEWQHKEQERILNLLSQQHEITAQEFERKVQKDQSFLGNLADHYHVSVAEIEAYIKQVIAELHKNGKFAIEKLQTWQLVEREYIKQLIAQYSSSSLTDAEIEQKLLSDRTHLRQLSEQYRIDVEKIEKWMLEELNRLRANSEHGISQLQAWQIEEGKALKELIKENAHLDYVSFEMELMKKQSRIEKLAQDYSMNVKQVEDWLRQQLLNLKTSGEIQVEALAEWQVAEQKRLIEQLLQQSKSTTYEEFEVQLARDRQRIENLAIQYQLEKEQVENWMRDELHRLQTSGLIQFEMLTKWQAAERQRLEEWIKQSNSEITNEHLNEFLKRDEHHLQRIAQEYQITVEEVENWIKMETARLRLLHKVKHDEINDDYELWKIHTKAHLQAIVETNPMSYSAFEEYLKMERPRWQQVSEQYNVTIEEVEMWLRKCASEFLARGLIYDSLTNAKWQVEERARIESLINEALRTNHQKWTMEQLHAWLTLNEQHLRQLTMTYEVNSALILEWYSNELLKLQNQMKILTEYLTDWQHRERMRIYTIILQQAENRRVLSYLETLLLGNKDQLRTLAAEYEITLQELEFWIKSELQKLVKLSVVQGETSSLNKTSWQQSERQRLRNIASEIVLTEQEILTFISEDDSFQGQLAARYNISLNQLAPYQRVQTNIMHKEGLLDTTRLLVFPVWNQYERDRLFNFIKTQNVNLKKLQTWQREETYWKSIAEAYGISLEALKEFQTAEYNRLVKISLEYKMSLKELQDFRDKELAWISYIMHKSLLSEVDRNQAEFQERKRLEALQLKLGFNEVELIQWRRRLYLLCQGLIPTDFEHPAPPITNHGTTNVTNIPKQIISKDRGDQPPNVHEEVIDANEPGLEGEVPHLIETTTRPNRPIERVTWQSARLVTEVPETIESGYRYTKKEYRFTVPAGAAIASASSNMTSSSATAAVIGAPLAVNAMYSHHSRRDNSNQPESQSSDENTQQQLQEESNDFEANYYDEGQQQQQLLVETNSDLQQNQIQEIEHSQYQEPEKLHLSLRDSPQDGKVQEPVHVNAEPEEKSSGFWSNIKKKTSEIFG